MRQQGIASFSSFSILVVFLLFCLVGVALAPLLSLQLFPSKSYFSITVTCSMPSASPQATEAQLTAPLEGSLSRITGVKKLSSTSGFGSTSITIELNRWTSPELFRLEAATIIRQLYPKLPKTASYPQLYLNRPEENNAFGNSIVSYKLSGPVTSAEIAVTVENVIKPLIAKVKGIYKFEVSGLKSEQLSISENNNKMRLIGVTHNDLTNIITTGSSSHDLGMVTTKEGRFNISIKNSINNLQELLEYPITSKNGRVFQLSNIADIKRENTLSTSFYRINGDDVISLNFYPEINTNTIKLAREIKGAMSVAEKRLPQNYRLALNYDNSIYLKDELQKIYKRTILSIFILFLFVLLIARQIKYLAIITTALIANVSIAFIFYYLFKLEIHLYSLAGITISLGMVIDNVIVIVEDIKHTGKNRIFSAILASTLTALGSLVVIFMLDDIQKVNLIDFALAIIINLIVSLPIAYFLIPALLDKFPIEVRINKRLFKRRRNIIKFNGFYEKQIRYMLRFRRMSFLTFALLFGLPLFMLPERVETNTFWANKYNSIIGGEYYSKTLRPLVNKFLGGTLYLYIKEQQPLMSYDDNKKTETTTKLLVSLTTPNGSTLNQINEICLDFEEYLHNFSKQLADFTTTIRDVNHANISISFKKNYEKGFPYHLKQLLENKAIFSGAADFEVSGIGIGFNNAINLNQYDSKIGLQGYDFNELQNIAIQVADSISKNPRIRGIFITTSGNIKSKPYQEYILNFTRLDYLNLFRIGRQNLSNSLQEFQEKKMRLAHITMPTGEYLPMELISNNNNVPDVWSTINAPMQVNDTTMLRLKNISRIKQIRLGENIIKQDQTYLLYIYYQFLGSAELNIDVKGYMIRNIKKMLPFGYTVLNDATGSWSAESNKYLWFISLVLLIIYLICAILLESFTKPLAVVLMIPFSFIGVFLTFYFFNLHFDQGGYAALLILAGLVTNSALYIINDINFISKNSRHSNTFLKIYIKSFNAKAIPILITTTSAILSLIPFMFNGQEKGFWFALSAGTMGGLLFSLLGAYLLLPICLIKKHA